MSRYCYGVGLLVMLGLLVTVTLSLSGCQSPGTVTQKVLSDFGIGEPPEGYVSGSDKVYDQLKQVGETEMRRLNAASREGEIKFEQQGLRGSYYKEVKVYEKCYPLDVRPITVGQDKGYQGYIQYTYRVYRSENKPSRVEAMAASVSDQPSGEGKETYRYTFSYGGVWDGNKGEKANR
ncbi:MAG TPA: hypothetical protein PK379_04085 [Candidatus Hydrogenedentes bacterium]|nr:hypothetical protein [Candidatus Hydrogenedentota bacterium]HOJ67498.1 hypothetical protein [Candidatus Hydrogenedentota bacterium]HOK89184.1 hypothetical protein [Candidatus Hydrogenedentota bacterium]